MHLMKPIDSASRCRRFRQGNMPAICGPTRHFAAMGRSYGGGGCFVCSHGHAGCAVRTNSPPPAQPAKKKLPQEHEGEWLIGRKGTSGSDRAAGLAARGDGEAEGFGVAEAGEG